MSLKEQVKTTHWLFQPITIFWFLLTIFWFISLSFRDLIHPDEGRYASIAMGMLQTGDWLTPRLNGILYFEKPILQYWISSFSFYIFGFTDFAARFWPGLSGILSVLAVGFTARKLWGTQVGHLAALVCAGTTWIFGNSHFLTLDMGVTFFLTVTLCSFVLAQRDEANSSEQRNWMWLAWAGMAGATLSKGLIGILIPGMTLFLYSLINWQWSCWRKMHWVTGLSIFLLLTAPWFYLVSAKNPGFAHFFFIREHFERFLTTEHRREGPIYYFIPILFAGFLPWTAWIPALTRDAWKKRGSRFQLERFVLIWCVFIFAFFSKSGSKLPSYILPMFPAMALLLAPYLARSSTNSIKKHLYLPIAIWALILVASPFVHHWSSENSPREVLIHFAWYLAGAATLFLMGAAIAWRMLSQGKNEFAVMAIAMATVLGIGIASAGHNSYGQLKSSSGVVEQVKKYITPDMQIYSVATYEQTFPYYLQRPVTLVQYVDEFEYGETTEPKVWIPTIAEFIPQWQAAPRAMAMLNKQTYAQLQQQGLPMQVVYQDVRRMVVIKPSTHSN
ncbi:glycosyltransferase family 39 protein [Chitinibacter bivalviorum]|uniref:Glycosyltransferase family 39 protein n=1 Tax=Chitinibacter bivalviorum TaxID=2739434 RepID=A0A7H9BGA0_9NEIS|nr:glycosyltransferase family 39 protein [Chitinibacter bivalviorum]QLG87286.1 glycosyltransferase family 39 protein [Chitinibacter bivalviorum]